MAASTTKVELVTDVGGTAVRPASLLGADAVGHVATSTDGDRVDWWQAGEPWNRADGENPVGGDTTVGGKSPGGGDPGGDGPAGDGPGGDAR